MISSVTSLWSCERMALKLVIDVSPAPLFQTQTELSELESELESGLESELESELSELESELECAEFSVR